MLPMIPALDAVAAILPKPTAAPALLGDGTFAALLPLEAEPVEEDEPVEAVTAEESLPLGAAQILLAPSQPAPLPDAGSAVVAEVSGQFGAMTDAPSASVSPALSGATPAEPELVGVDDVPQSPQKMAVPDSPLNPLTDATAKVRVRHLPPQTAERAECAGRILFEGRHLAVMPQEPGAVPAGGGAALADGSDDKTASAEVAPFGMSNGPQPAPTEAPLPSIGAVLAIPDEGADRSAPLPVTSQIRHAVQSALSPPVVTQPPDFAAGQVTDRQIELRLEPAELGAVSIILQGNEDALVVRITAERPDTLELMRRNSDQLLAELRAAGIGDAQMSFDMGRDQSHMNRSSAEAALMDALEDMPPVQVAPRRQSAVIPAGDTGLFIRV
jgi:flagellar hook-length control protein FliK